MSSVLRMRGGYSGLVQLINSITKPGDKITMVEVGSYAGESAEGFLSSGRVGHIFCVDPWQPHYDDKGDAASTSDFSAVEAAFDERHSKDARVTKVKGDVSVFADRYERGDFGDIKVDLVYIDACHTYDAVRNDISVTLSRIHPTRAIAGHDYTWEGVRTGVISLLGGSQHVFNDSSWIIRMDGVRQFDLKKRNRSAIVWATDGNDHEFLKYSVASMRMQISRPCDFFVLAKPSTELHDIDGTYAMMRIDPTPYMEVLGLTEEIYSRSGKSWPHAALYRLAIPLIERFYEYDSVLYVDSDTLALPDCTRTPDELLEYPMGDFEVAGAPDLYVDPARNRTMIDTLVPSDIKDELEQRVWSVYGTRSKTYINDGVLLFNVHAIDRQWYIKRCRSFSTFIGRTSFIDNDFVNAMLAVDDSLSTIFNSAFVGGGPYATSKACIRHYTAGSRSGMVMAASRIPEISPASRFEQFSFAPRSSDIKYDGTRRCIVWLYSASSPARNTAYSISTVRNLLESSSLSVDLVLLHESPLPESLLALDIRKVDVSHINDLFGFVNMRHTNWRGGWIHWDASVLCRVIIPFIEELAGYSSVLYMGDGTFVVDPRFFTVFDSDLTGYDCAMVGSFHNHYAVFRPSDNIPACCFYIRERIKSDESNHILGRLRAGLYFSSELTLFNMEEIRKTLVSTTGVRDLVVDMVGVGCPAAEHDLFNCVCRILPVSCAYNASIDTHYPGVPVYGISDKSRGSDYPAISPSFFHSSCL